MRENAELSLEGKDGDIEEIRQRFNGIFFCDDPEISTTREKRNINAKADTDTGKNPSIEYTINSFYQ